MQLALVFLLVLGFGSSIVSSVQQFDGQISLRGEHEDGYSALRKLLQEKPKKTKLAAKGGDGFPTQEKASSAVGKKSKGQSDAAGAAAAATVTKRDKKFTAVMDDGKLEASSELKAATKKPEKPKKKVVDEDDDEDIRFMEEEKKLQSVVENGKEEKKQERDELKDEEQTELGVDSMSSAKKESSPKKKEKSSKKPGAKKTDAGTIIEKSVGDEDADNLEGETEAEKMTKEDIALEEDNTSTVGERKKHKASPSKKKAQKQKKGEKKAPEVKMEIDDKEEHSDLDEVKVEAIPDEEDSTAKEGEKVDDMILEEVEVVEKKVPEKKKPPEKKDTKPPTKITKGDKDTSKTKPKTVKEKPKLDKSSATKTSGKNVPKDMGVKKEVTEVVTFPAADEDFASDAGKNGGGSLSLGDDQLEEDDLDVFTEFSDLPNKLQETATNVAATLGPGLSKLSEKSKNYFSQANQQMTESFTPIVGEQVAPVVASLISYGLVLLPLIVVIYMLERIRSALSLAKVLFFVNIYLAAYFLTLVLASFALGSEPMAFFFKHSRSSCVFLQLLQALSYMLYLLLYTVALMKSFSYGGVLDRLMACFQWLIVGLFGLHYYVTVFHRAMAMKVPRTTWKVYLVYSAAFSVLALFARAKIETSKKEYYYTPVDDAEDAVPVDKRS